MNLKHIYWRLESKYYKVCGQLLRWVPVKRNKIVLNNFHGFGYGDSPKYIADEIIRQKLPYDLVWLVSDMSSEFPPEVRPVKLQSARASYELSSAKVIISNVKVALPYRKKKSQFYIQTWHGSVAFKAIEKDAQDKLRHQYVKESMADSKLINLFLSCNSIQTQEIKSCFWYDGEVFESGSPRNDMLYKPKEYQQAVRKKIGLAEGKRLVLYAPTFRDSHRTDVYDLDLIRLKECLDSSWGDEWQVLVRLHPNVQNRHLFAGNEFVTDVTLYPDMQELLLIADALVTDYSTIIYDMAIMHKPILLYTPDLDDYKGDRGLKPVYFNLPTCICQSNEELLDYVSHFDHDEYSNRLNGFLGDIQIFDDGFASQRVVDRINMETKIVKR